MPPLYDAVLIASTGAMWTLAGYERITSGALQQEYTWATLYIGRPAASDGKRNNRHERRGGAERQADIQEHDGERCR